MTARETRLIGLGAGAGLAAALLIAGIVAARGLHGTAPEPATVAAQTAPGAQAGTDENKASGTQPGTAVELTPAEITAAGVQVAEVRTASLKTDIDAFGRVEQPEAQLAAVSARIGGRVDKLYVQYTGERVRNGEPVADIYSPDVATAIEEYHLAQENRGGLRKSDDSFARTQADALVKASQHRLELWGISERQMDASGTDSIPHVTIYSYAAGTVVERKVTQGQYVNAGDTLFTVADLSEVWIKADVYEEQLAEIRAGQEVKIMADSMPNKVLHGHVDFIEPAANQQTRTVPVHVHVANPGMRLLPGMFVNATFVSHAAAQSIVVPRSAVLDTGTRKIVYLARPNGVFEAREVQVGVAAEDMFPVIKGLVPGDRVVLNGNFLIDSQAHLSSGMSGLYGGSKEFAGGQQGQEASLGSAGKAVDAATLKLEFHADADPLKVGADNLFHVKLSDASGKAVGDARVTGALIMPAMPSMGMPEMKSSFELQWDSSSQMYEGKGQPPMPGAWNVVVEARRNGTVAAAFHTHLNAR